MFVTVLKNFLNTYGGCMYQFINNKYYKIYIRLVQEAKLKNRHKTDGNYYEVHHILPKSLGGDNSYNNLVTLTAREHFVAHLLLVRCVQITDVYRMINAIRRFTKQVKTSREYGILRSTLSRFSKGEFNPSHGKIWIYHKETLEISYVNKIYYLNNLRDSHIKGLPKQRGGHQNTIWIHNGKDEIMVQRNRVFEYTILGWTIGRITKPKSSHMKEMSKNRHTIEKDARHSKMLSGSKHFNYGKPAFNKGRVWVNDGNVSKMVLESEIPSLTVSGWSRGRLPKTIKVAS